MEIVGIKLESKFSERFSLHGATEFLIYHRIEEVSYLIAKEAYFHKSMASVTGNKRAAEVSAICWCSTKPAGSQDLLSGSITRRFQSKK